MIRSLVRKNAGAKAGNLHVKRFDGATQEQHAMGAVTFAVEAIAQAALPYIVAALQRVDELRHGLRALAKTKAPGAIQREYIEASSVGKTDAWPDVASHQGEEEDVDTIHSNVEELARDRTGDVNVGGLWRIGLQ